MADTIKCWNCGKAISSSAKACSYCEASAADAPTDEEKKFIVEMAEQMDPETMQALREAIGSSDSADELFNNIFVGACPACDSENTGHCGDDPEIDNLLVGRCLDCGCHWCCDCERILDLKKLECPCWDEEIPNLSLG